jgi:cobaltochelatase CobS
VVPVDDKYVFDNIDAMRLFMQCWIREWDRPDSWHRKGIYLFGPTGSGKTSFPEQFFARLGVPLVRTTWNPKREADEMVSSKTLVEGCLLDKDQAIAIAARQGLPLLINEIDLADPAELVSLNDIIEKGVITMPSGETFTAARGFIVLCTANTAGVDDEEGIYHGTRSQNGAFLRRFFALSMGYPNEKQELEFLKSVFPGNAEEFLGAVARVVTKIRGAYEGTLDRIRLSMPISRPETMDWVDMMRRMAPLKSRGVAVAEYTLGLCFYNRLPLADQTAVRQILADHFNDGAA